MLKRWKFVQAVLLRDALGKFIAAAAGLTAMLGAVQTWRSEFGIESKLIDWIPDWSGFAWACLALAFMVVLLFEASYRLYRSAEVPLATRTALTETYQEGWMLMCRSAERTIDDPAKAFGQWNLKLLQQVSALLEPAYTVAFLNKPNRVMFGTIEPRFDGVPDSDPYKQAFMHFTVKLDQLETLLIELRTASPK